MRKGLVGVVALLAGCASSQGLPLDDAVVRPTRYTAPALPPARSETVFTVRSVVSEGGAVREMPADCTFETDYSQGAFRAPARVALPDLGPQTPVVRVVCTNGELRGAAAGRAALRRGYGGIRPTIGLSVGTGYGYRGVGLGIGGLWGGYGYGPGLGYGLGHGYGYGGYGAGGLGAVYPDLAVELE